LEGQEIVITVRKSEIKADTLHGEIRLDGAFVVEGEVMNWSTASVDVLIHGLLIQAMKEKQLKLAHNWRTKAESRKFASLQAP